MAPYVLSWPGLPDMPFWVYDPKTKKMYSSENPVPVDKGDLDVFDNRYVKLSAVYKLFTPGMLSEVRHAVEVLEKYFDAKEILQITYGSPGSCKMSSYMSVVTLFTLIMIWPMSLSFQKMKETVLKYLDGFGESICTECGYIRRDCDCDRVKALPKEVFVGYGSLLTEKGTQTDLQFTQVMQGQPFGTGAGVAGGLQASNQGISFLIPSGVKLQPGMKIPVSLSGGSASPILYPGSSTPMALNMTDQGGSPFGFLKSPASGNIFQPNASILLPQSRPHKRGRPPVAPIPYYYHTSSGGQSNMAFYGPFLGDGNGGNTTMAPSFFPVSTWQGGLPGDLPQAGVPSANLATSANYIRPSASAGLGVSSSASQRLLLPAVSSAGDGLCHTVSRKRKFSESEADGRELVTMKTVGIQTMTKSFIKKSKLKEEKLSEKGDGSGKLPSTVLIVNESKDSTNSGRSSVLESGNQSEQCHMAASRQSSVDNATTSPAKAMGDLLRLNKDEKDSSSSKKFGGKLWRQLDDSSDDDKPPAVVISETKKVSEVSFVDEGSRSQNALEDMSAAESPNVSVVHHQTSEKPMDIPVLEPADKKEETSSNCAAESKDDDNASKMDTKVTEASNSDDPILGTSDLAEQTKSETTSTLDEKSGIFEGVEENDGDKDLTAVYPSETGENVSMVSTENTDKEIENFKFLPDTGEDESKSGDITNSVAVTNCLLPKPQSSADGNPLKTQAESSEAKALEASGSGPVLGVSYPLPSTRKIYGKFEYVPTKEHIFRCLIVKCSQSFDTRHAAELHNLVHPEAENVNHLKCPKCQFTSPYYHWFDLLRHMRNEHDIHISKDPFSCSFCGLLFESEEKLSSHIEFHYSNRYKCVHCGLLLLTWGQVKRHLETCNDKHRGNINLGCPYCTFVFHKKNIRNMHLLSHSDAGLTCALCQDNAPWSDWKTLRKHYQQKHSKILLGKVSPFRHRLPQKRKPPRCKKCDIEFKSMDLYSAHMTRTHDFVPYTLVECAQCGHRFRTERSHDWHVKHVHVEEISCEKCDFVATSKALMKSHVVQKHSDKQHTCSECDKSFAFFHQLKVHMAHHARRTIYPCQKCDQEFSRQSDLKQHLITEHSDPSEKAPQSCPECNYRCYSRATMNAHVMQDHPDLLRNDSMTAAAASASATAGAEEEEEGADHCYFTKKNDTPQLPEPPKVRRVGRKKGRQKKVVKYEWDRMKKLDNYSSVEDRRERRRLKQLVKEQEDRLKKLTKSTCARTRSYQEHQEMKTGSRTVGTADRESQLRDRHLLQSRAARAAGHATDEDESGVTESLGSGLYGTQPYLDHGYCKFECTGHEERLKQRLPAALHGGRAADGSVVDTPDVSAFQECETQLLGLGAMPLVRKRGRPPNSALSRPVLEARRRLASVLESGSSSSGVMQSTNYQTLRLAPRPAPSTSVVESSTAAEDDGLDIADFFGADTDILHSSIIDELLGMTNAPGVSYPADGAARKVHPALVDVPHASGAKFPDHSNRVVPEATGVIDQSFSDGLAIDSEAPFSADFDDIDLTEDVYSLFLGGGSNSVTPNSNGGATPLGNGEEASRIVGSSAAAISGVQQDILSLTAFPASTALLTTSPLHRGLVSPRRNSLLLRNSAVAQQQPPLSSGMSGAATATSAISAGMLVNPPGNVYTCATIPVQAASSGLSATTTTPLNNPPQSRVLSNSTASPATSFPGYAVSEGGGSHWTQQPYLDTSGLLSLSEAANLCLSSDSRNTNGSLVPFVKPFNVSKAGQVAEVSHPEDAGIREGGNRPTSPPPCGGNSSPAHDASEALNGDSSHGERETRGNPNGPSDDRKDDHASRESQDQNEAVAATGRSDGPVSREAAPEDRTLVEGTVSDSSVSTTAP